MKTLQWDWQLLKPGTAFLWFMCDREESRALFFLHMLTNRCSIPEFPALIHKVEKYIYIYSCNVVLLVFVRASVFAERYRWKPQRRKKKLGAFEVSQMNILKGGVCARAWQRQRDTARERERERCGNKAACFCAQQREGEWQRRVEVSAESRIGRSAPKTATG